MVGVLAQQLLVAGVDIASDGMCLVTWQPSKANLKNGSIELEPHVSTRHEAPTSSLRDTDSRYSLNKCDAWVTAAPARIAAATMAASVSIVSFAPA
jgi:hypothetical protein